MKPQYFFYGLLFFCWQINLLTPLWAFGGRIHEPLKLTLISASDKPTRKIVFLEFDYTPPLNENTNYVYNPKIDEIMAVILKKHSTTTVAKDNFIPVYSNLDKYTSYQLDWQTNHLYQQQIDTILTNLTNITNSTNLTNITNSTNLTNITNSTNLTNEESISNKLVQQKSVETNRISVERNDKITDEQKKAQKIATALTNIAQAKLSNTFAYAITNHHTKKMIYYVKKTNLLYIDANLSNTNYSSKEIKKILEDYIIQTNDYGQKYFYKNPINKQVKIEVANKIYSIYKARLLRNALRSVKADYFIYGQYHFPNRDDIFLKLFMMDNQAQTLELIFADALKNDSFYESIRNVTTKVLAKIQHKKVIKTEIAVNSTGKGGYFYLNNIFISKLPTVLTNVIEGENYFYTWHPEGEFKSAQSTITAPPLPQPQTNQAQPQTNQAKTNSTNFADKPKVSARLNFTSELKPKENLTIAYHLQLHQGELLIDVTNKIAPSIYLNTVLTSSNQSIFRTNLSAGTHFVQIDKEGYRNKWIKAEIHKDMLTAIRLNLLEEKPKNWWEEVFLNHDRNTLIFTSLTLATFGFWLYELSEAQRLENIVIRHQDALYSGSFTYFSNKNTEFRNHIFWRNAIGGTSLAALTLAIISRVFFIKSNIITVESIGNNSANVSIELIKIEKKF